MRNITASLAASQDRDVIAAKKAIDGRHTDVEKRELMRNYYKFFYGRMQALADKPDVKAYVKQKQDIHIDSLAQPRVHPGIGSAVEAAPVMISPGRAAACPISMSR
jgi:hypothetical protein